VKRTTYHSPLGDRTYTQILWARKETIWNIWSIINK
jgi:hypothetical protein